MERQRCRSGLVPRVAAGRAIRSSSRPSNFNDKIAARGGTVFGGSQHLSVVERLTRTGPNSIDYEITVTDPTVWTEPFTVSTPMTKMNEGVWEYACHEGNYALPNILSGARAEERAAAGNQQ